MNQKKTLTAFIDWYSEIQRTQKDIKGITAVSLQILDKLKKSFNLELDKHLAKNKAQLSGVGGPNLKRVLEKFGENRLYVKEGGRTNRGSVGAIESMFGVLKEVGIEQLDEDERNRVIREMQLYLVSKIVEYHNRQKIEIDFTQNQSLWKTIQALIETAGERNQKGQVAQYLVGAKLQQRFPDMEIGNESYSTADDQLGRQGDFLVGDTVFHVTITPMPALYEKCRKNISQGYKVYLLVPDAALVATRQNVFTVNEIQGSIVVESIESFVSQNIEELSGFSKRNLVAELKKLIDTYNKRVDSIESDKSLLIELPSNL